MAFFHISFGCIFACPQKPLHFYDEFSIFLHHNRNANSIGTVSKQKTILQPWNEIYLGDLYTHRRESEMNFLFLENIQQIIYM